MLLIYSCKKALNTVDQLKMKDFVFEVTKKSMQFYERFFGVKYQFNKYDSVFVAEYNWGAMQNPGLVTFNDLYVFKEQKPATSYTQLANTIAHEMAHHWFGDFVTMKWWNDLWLNVYDLREICQSQSSRSKEKKGNFDFLGISQLFPLAYALSHSTMHFDLFAEFLTNRPKTMHFKL